MGTGLVCILIVTQIVAHAEVVFIQKTEGESVRLSWSAEQTCNTLTGLHLYHSSTQGQMTLLSVVEGNKLRVSPEYRGRLELSGGLGSPQVNVTISHLGRPDTGLYVSELTYSTANNSYDLTNVSSQKVFLLVEVSGRTCRCSSSYTALLYAIATAVGLLLLTIIWLGTVTCAKERPHHKPQPPVLPIYEEMNSKQQCAGSPQNSHESPFHLEEADFPVYANPNVRQAQDNHYACPRQTALM